MLESNSFIPVVFWCFYNLQQKGCLFDVKPSKPSFSQKYFCFYVYLWEGFVIHICQSYPWESSECSASSSNLASSVNMFILSSGSLSTWRQQWSRGISCFRNSPITGPTIIHLRIKRDYRKNVIKERKGIVQVYWWQEASKNFYHLVSSSEPTLCFKIRFAKSRKWHGAWPAQGACQTFYM